MSVHDYLIEHSGFDWSSLLSSWAWLLPPKFAVWLMNRFGDLFITLPDGDVHMLDVGAGALERLAKDRDNFARMLDEGDNANLWLMIPLVDSLTAAGIWLQDGQCYSFVVPPVLGGGYTPENIVVLPVQEHYGVYGSHHNQMRGVPDGQQVTINVTRRPPS